METAAKPAVPRSLFIFSIIYGGLVCMAGVLGNKLVALGPLAVESGIFAFLLLVVLSSAVAEQHGRPVANKLVLFGFIPLLMSTVLIELVLSLPAADAMDAARLAAFETILGQSARMMLAGLVAYGTSQMLNVTIFSALKRGGGRMLWLRAAIASVASQIVDTLLFITIAFYGVFPITSILIGQMLAKVTLSIVLVPALVYLFLAIGRKLDRQPL